MTDAPLEYDSGKLHDQVHPVGDCERHRRELEKDNRARRSQAALRTRFARIATNGASKTVRAVDDADDRIAHTLSLLRPMDLGMLATDPPRREFVACDDDGCGVIPAGELCGIAGPGGTGKSIVELDLVYARAVGGKWLGRYPVVQGHAAFYTAEETEEEIHRRLHAIIARRGFKPEMVHYLHVFSTRGIPELRLVDSTGIAPFGEALVQQMAGWGPTLALLDPVRAYAPNIADSEADVNALVSAMRWILEQTDSTVLLSHHSSQATLINRVTDESAFKGVMNLTDGMRWTMTIAGVDRKKYPGVEGIANYRQYTMPKANYSEARHGMFMHWVDGCFDDCEEPTAGADEESQQRIVILQRLLQCIESRAKQGDVTPSQLVKDCRATNPTPEQIPISKDRLPEFIKQAAERNLIERLPHPKRANFEIVRITDAGRRALGGMDALR